MGETVGDASVVDLRKVLGSSSLEVASTNSFDKKELASNEKLSFKTRPDNEKKGTVAKSRS